MSSCTCAGLFWHIAALPAAYTHRFISVCVSPPAQVQVLSAALKAAQLDSPTDDSPTEPPTELLHEGNASSDELSVESKSVEVQSESDESPTEEEQTMETLSTSESCPVQEQGDEETQTEPLDDPEESPPGSPVLVRNCSVTLRHKCILCSCQGFIPAALSEMTNTYNH